MSNNVQLVQQAQGPAPAPEALHQSQERFRLMVGSVKDYAIFMLDAQGYVETWNAGAQAIKGYLAEEVIGKPSSTFYTPEDQARGKPQHLLQLARKQGRIEDEGWRVRRDGTRFWADVVITAVFDAAGVLQGYTKVTRDLTDRKDAEAERLRLAQAQEAVRLRDEFLSIASHELKTPLSAVQLQLQSLLHEVQSLDAKVRNKAERAFKGGERLLDLVEALLDVSRIATGRFTLNRSGFDLARSVEEVAERFREQAAHAGCELILHLEEPVPGEWDRLRLEQVVTNLLANALKYAAGTPVELTVRAEGANAVLTVSDQGPGIPESEWGRIFERFERAASIRHHGGLGLGLYVAREVAEGHGGTIALEAVKPHGARFIVTLPRVPPPPPSTGAEVAS